MICTRCREPKQIVEMARSKAHPGGIYPWCLACCREAGADRNRSRAKERRAQVNDLKASPCLDCGRSYPPCCMDFDHVREEKQLGVGRMLTYNQERLLAEIAKCDLVCACCHRLRTQKRATSANPRYRAFAEKLAVLKAHPCLDCGQTFPPAAMDFDHVRGEKAGNIAQMFTTAWPKVLAEVAKCDLVCANCHRLRTNARQATRPVGGRPRRVA